LAVSRIETCLVVPDLHVPFVSGTFLKLVTKLIKLLEPSYLVQLGDLVDCYYLSNFPKLERSASIKEELEEAKKILNGWERIMPEGSSVFLLEGNHEKRLKKYIASRCDDLKEIIPSLFDFYDLKQRNLGRLNWHWFENNKWDSCKIGDVIFHHGSFFNVHCAGTNLARYSCKFVQGHTHRTALAYDGKNWSATVGHGLDITKLDYIDRPMAWSQAIGVVTFVNGIGSIELIEVKNDTSVFRGKHLQA
jgi:hypothetical protein